MKLIKLAQYGIYKLFNKRLSNKQKVKAGELRRELDDAIFPCSSDNCLVRAACTKACELIEMDEDKLVELFTTYRCCPDCGSGKFYEGPSGGAAQNMQCTGCGHWFNMGLPLFAQRIHISPNGRFGS